jgi:hypothetical protein
MDPESSVAYIESMNLAKAVEHHEMGSMERAEYCLLVLNFLGVEPGVDNRRALRDIVRAYVMIVPFFPDLPVHSITNFLASKHGKRFRDSKLLKPHERMQVPNRRSHTSNKYRPKEFWKEWQQIEKSGENPALNYPHEWRIVSKPIIAKCKSSPSPKLYLTR